MKPRQMIILLLVMALIDDLISLCFPVNFQFQGYSFVPHFCFITLMLLIYERGWLDRVLISGFCGVLTDLFFSGTLPVYFIIYAGLGYLSGIFNKAMEEDSRIRFFFFICSGAVIRSYTILGEPCFSKHECIFYDLVHAS